MCCSKTQEKLKYVAAVPNMTNREQTGIMNRDLSSSLIGIWKHYTYMIQFWPWQHKLCMWQYEKYQFKHHFTTVCMIRYHADEYAYANYMQMRICIWLDNTNPLNIEIKALLLRHERFVFTRCLYYYAVSQVFLVSERPWFLSDFG